MSSPFFRQLLLSLCVTLGPGLLAASETVPANAPARDEARPAETAVSGPVVELPIIEVRESRIRELDKEIGRLDKLIAREKKKVKSSDLDRALNNTQLTRAAAIFGGNSAGHLSAVAATRVALLETERSVLEAMKRPGTAAALTMLETELDQLRVTRRNLDDAAKQR